MCRYRSQVAGLVGVSLILLVCGTASRGTAGSVGSNAKAAEGLPLGRTHHAISFDYANLELPIAGVAGGSGVVFVGEPLNGAVIALSRLTGNRIGELPPPNGFVVPFIIHSLGEGRVTILDAGGLPQPAPFAPTNP